MTPRAGTRSSGSSGRPERRPGRADWVFRGGPIHTVDPGDTVVEALAVAGDLILAAGRESDVLALAGPGTRVFDLRGRSLIPGIVESHNHFLGAGVRRRFALELGGPDVRSMADLLARISDRARRTPAGRWIRGVGYMDLDLKERRPPTRHDLDRAAPDHPVVAVRACGHVAVANSRALAMAGIARETPDPQGGEIERDARGEPTGVLKERAQRPVRELARYTLDELRTGVAEAERYFLAHGITSAHDMSGGQADEIRVVAEAAREGRLRVRVTQTLQGGGDSGALGNLYLKTGLVTGVGDGRFRLGPYKLMLDGSDDAATAAMTEPYPRPGPSGPHRGILYYDQEQVNELLLAAHLAGFQLSVHAIGDAAVEQALVAFEHVDRAAAAAGTRRLAGARPRIEHCCFIGPGHLERIRALGVVPVTNPAFLPMMNDGYFELVGRGGRREAGAYLARSFLAAGVPATGSSDCPVTTVDPLVGLAAAVTRQTAAGFAWRPEEAVTLSQALRMYTINGAYAGFREQAVGSLEPGKLADLVVLSGDLAATAPEAWPELQVDLTMIGGELVYQREDGAEQAGGTANNASSG